MTVIDRFEGGYAVLASENGSINITREQLPPEAAEGDVLIFKNDSYLINKEATSRKRRQTRARLRRLIKEDKQ
ncbi:MAG: DUF3006 domain-containing protein [Ruminococcus sp.]|nr:DUF3006 domain-containing protein [Ruminococcus sp.]